MLRFSSIKRFIIVVLLAAMLACTETLPAVISPLMWDRRKFQPDPADDAPPANSSRASEYDRGDGAPDPYIVKPRPVPKAPAAVKPQPKPQPKPRPGAKATPSAGGPAPTPPITRPT